jgi:predicted lactoylglutathione lyase
MPSQEVNRNATCIVHFSLALGSREKVDSTLRKAADFGCRIIGQPRVTGDGYYEASFLDPEGNTVELTVLSAKEACPFQKVGSLIPI